MKHTKIFKALQATLLITAPLLSFESSAATNDYEFAFKTVEDVSISEVTGMDFGGKMTIASGTTCKMTVDLTNRPSDSLAQLGNVTDTAENDDYANLVGVGCGTPAGVTDGQPGVYEVKGAGGVEVEITLKSTVGNSNFNFVPEGVVGIYDNLADQDNLIVVPADTATTTRLASLTDVTGRTAGGSPNLGTTLLFVGGTVTLAQDLVAGTTYTESFNIDVTYK